MWWLVAAVLFSGLAVWKKMLSWGGALAASILGLWVIYWAGAIWLVPLLFFFLSSSILGKLLPKKVDSDAKAGKARDAWQVFCNGGVYGILASFASGPHQEIVHSAMILSMAIATSDTWSSEIGVFFRGRTWDILSWKPLQPGLSGGISLQGTLAGVLGSLLLVILGSFLLPQSIHLNWLLITTLLGTAGMFLDSFLGAALQARYVDPVTGFEYDYRVRKFRLSKGKKWMTNDLVNLFSNVAITGLGWILFS